MPFLSKATGYQLADIATNVILGTSLKEQGIFDLYPPEKERCYVKAPVFSFAKLHGLDAYLSPEMKSTGEVLGLGKTMQEALFKGLTSAGMVVGQHPDGRHGVFVSVDTHDLGEIVSLAKKLDDLHFALYATEETAAAIARLGIDVVTVDGIRESDHAFALLESGCIDYIGYTGALMDATMDDYIALHRRALQLGIPCFTSLDTANALADIIASRYNERNTELVDINHMRTERQSLKFAKMQATGDDYITSRTLTDTSPAPSRCASRSARATAASAATASCSSSTATWPTRKCVSSTATAAPAAWAATPSAAWPSTCTTTASCRATISRSRPAAPCTGCTCTRASARSAS